MANVNPNSLDNFSQKPYLIVFPVIYLTGLIGLFFIKKLKKIVMVLRFHLINY